jgi:hypothetical protein
VRASRITIVAVALLAATGCSSPISISNDNNQQLPPGTAPPSSTRPSNDKLVNAFDYYARTDGDHAGYYFVSPSGSWRCVIVPRTWAGCQSSGGGLGVTGAPQAVTAESGQSVAPNSILVRTEGDPQFASVKADLFKPPTGAAKKLPFNKILAAAGFRCNVQQEAGISCVSDETDKGFTFTASGATWKYTEVR